MDRLMSRIIVVTLLLALGACFYAPAPYYGGGSGWSDRGGPGPGNVPINPGAGD
jgi:hypothetical protein